MAYSLYYIEVSKDNGRNWAPYCTCGSQSQLFFETREFSDKFVQRSNTSKREGLFRWVRR